MFEQHTTKSFEKWTKTPINTETSTENAEEHISTTEKLISSFSPETSTAEVTAF